MRSLDKGQNIYKNDLSIDVVRMKRYQTYIQVFAAFTDKKVCKISPMENCLSLIRKYKEETEKNPCIKRILTKDDLKDISSGGIYSILSIEGGEALNGDINALDMYYNHGVRLITLTWNYRNEIADGALEESGRGLTEFGRRLVAKMEEKGVLTDVSHISEKGFWDVSQIAKKPFVASHSCAAEICNHPRNLSDKQIKCIGNKGGVVGVNFYPVFLSKNGKCEKEAIVDNICYILNKGGEDAVGFGSDFDGVDCLPNGITGAESMEIIVDMLKKRGLKQSQTDKIAYKNFIRVFNDDLK